MLASLNKAFGETPQPSLCPLNVSSILVTSTYPILLPLPSLCPSIYPCVQPPRACCMQNEAQRTPSSRTRFFLPILNPNPPPATTQPAHPTFSAPKPLPLPTVHRPTPVLYASFSVSFLFFFSVFCARFVYSVCLTTKMSFRFATWYVAGLGSRV